MTTMEAQDQNGVRSLEQLADAEGLSIQEMLIRLVSTYEFLKSEGCVPLLVTPGFRNAIEQQDILATQFTSFLSRPSTTELIRDWRTSRDTPKSCS